MAKAKTASFILTLRLKTEPFHRDRLNKKFEYVRFLYNKLVEEGEPSIANCWLKPTL